MKTIKPDVKTIILVVKTNSLDAKTVALVWKTICLDLKTIIVDGRTIKIGLLYKNEKPKLLFRLCLTIRFWILFDEIEFDTV